MLEQNIWNYILSKSKLQNRLFMGTISLTIAGTVISSNQERMVQGSYFCQSSKLLKNICEEFIFNEVVDYSEYFSTLIN